MERPVLSVEGVWEGVKLGAFEPITAPELLFCGGEDRVNPSAWQNFEGRFSAHPPPKNPWWPLSVSGLNPDADFTFRGVQWFRASIPAT